MAEHTSWHTHSKRNRFYGLHRGNLNALLCTARIICRKTCVPCVSSRCSSQFNSVTYSRNLIFPRICDVGARQFNLRTQSFSANILRLSPTRYMCISAMSDHHHMDMLCNYFALHFVEQYIRLLFRLREYVFLRSLCVVWFY